MLLMQDIEIIEENKKPFEMGNQKVDYITTLSVISSLAVVILHTNGAFWQFNSTARYWFTANIIESVFYFAVPIFYMISGITLIDYNKRYSLREYFKKRVTKTVIPFLFWSLVYLLLQICLHHISVDKLSLASIINGILTTQYVGIFWFFIPLFSCYMIIPVLSNIADKKKTFRYILLVSIFCNSFIPFVINVFRLPISWNLTFPIVGYSIYILLGYYLDKIHFTKNIRVLIYFFAIVGLLMHIAGTYYLSIAAKKIIQTYKGYLNIPCVLYSIGIYVCIKENYKLLIPIFSKPITYLKHYSFALYLLQFFFLIAIPKLLHLNIFSIGWRLGGVFLILPLVILATKIIRLLPLGKYILP